MRLAGLNLAIQKLRIVADRALTISDVVYEILPIFCCETRVNDLPPK